MLNRIKPVTTYIDLGLRENMIFHTLIKYLFCNYYRVANNNPLIQTVLGTIEYAFIHHPLINSFLQSTLPMPGAILGARD